MAARSNDSTGGELYQIVLLTLLMTGGGLILFFLAMDLVLLPSRVSDARSAARRYQALDTLLMSTEMKDLRAQQLNEEQSERENKTLLEILHDKRQRNGLEFERLHQSKFLSSGGESRQVDLRPAEMRSILQFLVEVTEARGGLHVESFTLTPSRARGAAATDAWQARVTFVDTAPPGAKDRATGGAGRPAAS